MQLSYILHSQIYYRLKPFDLFFFSLVQKAFDLLVRLFYVYVEKVVFQGIAYFCFYMIIHEFDDIFYSLEDDN